MDKFEKILDVIDHQEKYSDDEIREILKDEECRKLYLTMQEVDSALLKQSVEEADGKVAYSLDVDAEWEKFCEMHYFSRFSWRKIAASIVGFVLVSGIAFAAIHTYMSKSRKPMPIAENTEHLAENAALIDTAKMASTETAKPVKPAVHKTFVNVSLAKMMAEIGTYYDYQVKFVSEESKKLRLYYEWDSHTKLEDVVKELNQFENVDIALQGNGIIVK